MEELENFKKKWNDDPKLAENYSKQELFAMTKKSTKSLGKKLFIIGSIEVFLWSLFSYLDEDFNIIRIVVFVVFWTLIFFKYLKINNGNDTLSLIRSIRNLRFLILFYVFFSIITIAISFVLDATQNTQSFVAGIQDGYNNIWNHTDPRTIEPTLNNFLLYSVVCLMFIPFLILIYNAVYGRILQKLKQNYLDLIEE